MGRLRKIAGERTLYQDPNSGTYYVRVYHEGKDTFRSLETTRIGQARERLDARRAAKAAARLGLALEPDDSARSTTVAAVIKRYQADGYPDKRGRARSRLGMEPDNCVRLLKFFDGESLADDLSPRILDDYHSWRLKNVTRGEGHRTTDLELNTLNNAVRWAVRKEMVRINPIASRTRYHSATEARHCRECAPADAEELHSIARLLFASQKSDVLGWQLLFEAMTGLRTGEALSLRMNARSDEPGGLTADGGSLCVRRSKNPARDNPYVRVHEGLKPLIEAHRVWHQSRFPASPWYFPGRGSNEKPLSKCALTRTLERLLRQKKLNHKITSHGLRAFYVLVRRSQGTTDAQIAWEINHVGGVGTLEKVYGGVPPHWLDGHGPKLGWLPEGGPAWRVLVPATQAQALNER